MKIQESHNIKRKFKKKTFTCTRTRTITQLKTG